MPRKGKGAKVEGAAQTAYANRTDLNQRGPQPITVAPGQAYGEAKMQEDAQRAVPMGGTPQPQVTGASGPHPADALMGSVASAAQAAAPAEPGTMDLMAPTDVPPQNVGVHPPNMDAIAQKRVSDFLEKMAASPYASQRVKEMAVVSKLAGL
jgi:hypothetical protein